MKTLQSSPIFSDFVLKFEFHNLSLLLTLTHMPSHSPAHILMHTYTFSYFSIKKQMKKFFARNAGGIVVLLPF